MLREVPIVETEEPDLATTVPLRLDSLAEAEEWIAETWAGWQADTVATWAIASGDGPVLGRISLYFRDLRSGLGEVSYQVAPEARRVGLATQSLTR